MTPEHRLLSLDLLAADIRCCPVARRSWSRWRLWATAPRWAYRAFGRMLTVSSQRRLKARRLKYQPVRLTRPRSRVISAESREAAR